MASDNLKKDDLGFGRSSHPRSRPDAVYNILHRIILIFCARKLYDITYLVSI